MQIEQFDKKSDHSSSQSSIADLKDISNHQIMAISDQNSARNLFAEDAQDLPDKMPEEEESLGL